MPQHPPPSAPLRQSLRAIHALMLREVASAEARSFGGYLWAVLEPVAALSLLAGVCALAFEAPPLGRDFALFYASGYLPFMLYSDLAQKLGVALRFSRPLLAYPAVSWIDALLARMALALLTHAVVIPLVLLGLWGISSTPLQPDLPRLLAGLGLGAALGAAMGCFNAALFGLWPLWERLWSIANRPLFLLSGVLFLPEKVPAPYGDILLWNPLCHVISLTRAGIYGGYGAPGASPLWLLGIVALLGLTGLALLHRHARGLLALG